MDAASGAPIAQQLASAKPARDLIGIVDRISGRWNITHDDRPLRVRSPIHSGERIAPRDSRAGSITIYLLATGKPWTTTCSKEQPCHGTYEPAAPAPSGPWAFLTSFAPSEARLDRILPAGRGTSSGGPNHALVTRSATTVDLAAALQHVAPGDYILRFTPITETGGEPVGHDATVRAGDDAGMKVPLFGAGLYRVTVVDQSGQTVGLPAVVLALDDTDLEARALWKDAVSQTQSWNAASQGTIDSALVRVLFALNERRTRG
jgi:hypothetical protein